MKYKLLKSQKEFLEIPCEAGAKAAEAGAFDAKHNNSGVGAQALQPSTTGAYFRILLPGETRNAI